MSGGWSRPISDFEADRITTEINEQGYGTLRNFVSEAELAPVRAIARSVLRESGGEYAWWAGAEAFSGTVLSELSHSTAFKDLCRRLFQRVAGDMMVEDNLFQTFRCLHGDTGQSRHHFYAFHYDGFVLTTILPVAIPENAPHGDLVIVPNTRRIRQWYVSSLVESNFVKLAPIQFLLGILARQRKLNTVTVRLKPGDLYFIWGYQSLHANGPCARDTLRATAIFQYGNPHQHSTFSATVRNVMPRVGVRKLYWSNQKRHGS